MQYVNQIAGTIVNFLTEKAGEQLGYLMHYRSHINDLKEKAENLQNERERVQRQIDAAKRNVEEIELKVQKWVKDVDALTKDATEFLEADQAKANHRCFNGWCINLCSRYKFGKEAYEKASEITKHQDPKFESVSYPAPLPEIESSSSSSKIFSAFESRKSTVKQIIKALEETSINVIGICGMGGVGKTTIVEEVRRQAKEKKLFDEIAMVVVSQTPSLTKIQDGIASKLGLSFGTSEDESERARKLWARIQQNKKILVILDDVWAWRDLKKVGIPFGEDHMGCKLVLTSRSNYVCIEMNAQKIFPIEVLSEKEAWVLFREMVGEAGDDSSDLNLIAREVARECGGLPLAIVTVGRALKNRSNYEWTDAAIQLKKSIATTITGMDAYVYSSLELSYNYLEREAKSFFLLCSLFPEDAYIPVEEMVKYGTGLRLFQGVDTIEEGRVRAHALVSALVSSFLLLDDDNNGVKMHDVVRHVAISIASSKDQNNKYLVKAGIGLRDCPDSDDTTSQNYTGISLMGNDIQKLPDELEWPKLETLLLQKESLDIELQIPTNFFRGMRDLKVLDMSGNQIVPLPPSLPLLTTLRTLRLDNCRLGDVSIIGTLKQLEILSLFGSNIDAVPGHFAQLTHLRLLDISRCFDLRHISPGVLSSLCKLEELYTYEGFSYWAVEDEDSKSSASLTELTSLSRLTTLHVFAQSADMLPHDLKFQNLINFHISIGCHGTRGGAEYKKSLSLTYDTRLSGPVEVLVKRTNALSLEFCKGLKNMLKDLNDNNGFDELKYLAIAFCGEMKYLLDMVDWVSPRMAFRNLEALFLDSLDDFSEICHGQLPAESFGKVRVLRVSSCPSMSNIVSSDLLRRLQYLKSLRATFCDSLLNVFDLEGLANEGEDIELLSRLERLYLDKLPELMHIWKGTHHFVNLRNLRSASLYRCAKLRQLFPPSLVQGLVRLELLNVRGCSNLEEIFGTQEEEEKEIQTEITVVGKINSLRASSTSLQNLTRVYLHGCDRLRNIFTPSIAKNLVQLRDLEICECAMMEAAVGGGGDEKGEATVVASSSIDQEKKIVFPRLSGIQLFELDSLTCFCTGSYAVEFPSLEKVYIYRCPKMETFGHGVQITPNLKKVQFRRDINESSWMGDLNATIRHIFKQKIWAD